MRKKCGHEGVSNMVFKIPGGSLKIRVCSDCNLVLVSATHEQVIPLIEFRKTWNKEMEVVRRKLWRPKT